MAQWSCSPKLFRAGAGAGAERPPEDSAHRARVGGVVVRRDQERPPLRDPDEPPEEAPDRVLVALLAQHRIDELPVAVDGPVEVAPPPGDLDAGLVDIPGPARLAASPDAGDAVVVNPG